MGSYKMATLDILYSFDKTNRIYLVVGFSMMYMYFIQLAIISNSKDANIFEISYITIVASIIIGILTWLSIVLTQKYILSRTRLMYIKHSKMLSLKCREKNIKSKHEESITELFYELMFAYEDLDKENKRKIYQGETIVLMANINHRINNCEMTSENLNKIVQNVDKLLSEMKERDV